MYTEVFETLNTYKLIKHMTNVLFKSVSPHSTTHSKYVISERVLKIT